MKEIILIGSSGKMGQMIINNIKEPYAISSKIDLKNNNIVEKNAYAVIDFSSSKATMFYAPYYISKGIPYICGTTGLLEEEINLLENMTIHYNSHFRLASSFDLNFYMINNFLKEVKDNFTSVTMEEWHHISKKDIPSGVAKEFIKSIYPLSYLTISHRSSSHIQRHQITFNNKKQRLRISYEVLSRTTYMDGIYLALDNISLKGFFKGL